jgi:HEAT repeat protein
MPDWEQKLEEVIREARSLEGDDTFGRTQAIAGSGDLGLAPRAEAALANFLDEGNFVGRDLMATVLAGLRGVDAIETLLRAWARDLRDDRDSLTGLIWQLMDADRAGCRRVILALTDDRDPDVRRTALWALGHVADPSDVDQLVAAATDVDPQTRSLALGALSGLQRDDRAFAAHTHGLADPDPDVRRSAVSGLGYSNRPDAVAPLLRQADDGSSGVRMSVAYSLGRLADRAAIPALLAYLGDTDAYVRDAAVHALGEVGGPDAVAALLRIGIDPDPAIRAKAASPLVKNLDPDTSAALGALAGDGDASVRASTVAAIGFADATSLTHLVLARADDPDPVVRARVAVAVERLDPAAATPILERYRDDPDPHLRRLAARQFELRTLRRARPRPGVG